MLRRAGELARLVRAGHTLARYRALAPEGERAKLPASARAGLAILALGRKPGAAGSGMSPLVTALTELGPSYIKLGQFLATRADIVGAERAAELSALQDKLPPFPQSEAEAEIAAGLGEPVDKLFVTFGPAVAAASIAQVHKALTQDGREVAVKILRPGIERKFAADLDAFFFAARQMQRWHYPSKRLRPVDAVATLAQSVKLEMDLRMEAAAMSEMARNTAADPGFRVPDVDWALTSRRVLTTEWIDGTPLSALSALEEQGHDLKRLADTVIQSFLRHAIRDGFFHADMHPGNLFVDEAGNLVAVDFGIMGRLGPKERLFLAEILFGFITRDYARVSRVHFEAGYVPTHQDPAVFAQALRAIGEPLMDKRAEEISMARLLAQLFQVTEQFDMRTQPQLLLLQKTMVVVEGVARTLDPKLNMWVTAEPVVREWIEQKFGAQGRIEDAAEGAASLGRLVGAFPELLAEAQKTAHVLAGMADSGGLRLDRETTEALAEAQARHGRWGRAALWVGALALAALALMQFI